MKYYYFLLNISSIIMAFKFYNSRHNQKISKGWRFFSKNFNVVTEEELTEFLVSKGQPKFRAKQIRTWVQTKGITDFNDMNDLPINLRNILSEEYSFGCLEIASEQVSKDGTCKRAYRLHDGQIIESVLMPYEDGRRTACISSQAGCAMGCVFCATGQMGFARQLTSNEIFEQAQKFSLELTRKNERLSNVVMMGMGEPLANYKNVMEAVRRINTELGIGARHITLSTSGLAPRIRTLADEDIQVGLAISLHQTTDEKRSPLMPVNEKYPIKDLIESCRYYINKTGRRITFEWALIRNQTDTIQTAHELGQLLRGMLCHVNVIPLNPTQGFDGRPTPKKGVDEFIAILDTYGVPATPRTRRGIDIDAGCGQLKADLLRKKSMNQTIDTTTTTTTLLTDITSSTVDMDTSTLMDKADGTCTPQKAEMEELVDIILPNRIPFSIDDVIQEMESDIQESLTKTTSRNTDNSIKNIPTNGSLKKGKVTSDKTISTVTSTSSSTSTSNPSTTDKKVRKKPGSDSTVINF